MDMAEDLFIIAGCFGRLTLHLTYLCAMKQYQGAECLDFFVNGLRLGLIHGKQRVHTVYPYTRIQMMIDVCCSDVL